MCNGNNRKGFFCNQCVKNHGPSAFSSKCYKCDRSPASALALSLIIKLVPVFTVFILIATFRINITKGPMLGYIIYCQMFIVTAREASQPYATLLAYSNFLLIQLHMRNCRVVVICWRPFHFCFGRVRRNISASDKAIHAFASLWLLSFVNINYSTFDLIAPACAVSNKVVQKKIGALLL